MQLEIAAVPIKHMLQLSIENKLFAIFFFKRCTRVARVEKNIWKMKFFLGQGKVREFCGRSGKFRKDLESQGI